MPNEEKTVTHLIYDGIHYNALVLNKQQKQTGEATPNMKTDLKTKSKQNCNSPEATNTKHIETTQANVTNGI